MNRVILFMAIVAFAVAAQLREPFATRSISSTVEKNILEFRDQMPCGFPKFGIPPLAPLDISHKDLNIDTPYLRLNGSIHNFRLNGLNDFEVVEMKVNAIKKKVIFTFLFNNINVDTLHNFELFCKQAGLSIDLLGAGRAKFSIQNLRISGDLKYSFSFISQQLKFKSIDIRVQIGNVESNIKGVLGDGLLNYKLNEVLEEAVQFIVNENSDLISETIQTHALPPVNNELSKYKLNDLVGIITGGNEGEKVKCEPPQQ